MFDHPRSSVFAEIEMNLPKVCRIQKLALDICNNDQISVVPVSGVYDRVDTPEAHGDDQRDSIIHSQKLLFEGWKARDSSLLLSLYHSSYLFENLFQSVNNALHNL